MESDPRRAGLHRKYEKENVMLVVTVEVWPWGREERKYKIGEITAANISNGRIATYEVRVHCDGYEPEGLPAIDEEFLLRDHDRSAGALALIRDALLVTIPLPEEGDGASDAGPGSISPDV
ncbi:hypothetical protein GGR90_001686 [Sphingopyxis italica]|uniref:Uncharacterized protein n=1 Tax=Sphingopyxis italica TaxID=1129133 RepID=A0A7X5XSK9_9SPHN|nr:hypothetical protein [Sphingopyxis italica]NJB89511.1 hypothetical protein [Sphingopyxis italica]